MAKKRMFSLDVIDTDTFIEMPISSRLLYYELGMRADDDGFVDNWKKIMAFTGLKEDDLKILITKKYVIPFDSGVIVIRHWRMNNYLQSDRKKATIYKEELNNLHLDNNNVYNLDTDCIHSIVECSIDECSIDKCSCCNDTIVNNSNNVSPATNETSRETVRETSRETIFEYWEKNMGIIPSSIVEKIKNWQKEFSDDILKYAIDKCCEKNIRNYSYFNGILKQWKDKKYETLADCKNEFSEYQRIKEKNKPKSGMQKFHDTLDEWERKMEEEEKINDCERNS